MEKTGKTANILTAGNNAKSSKFQPYLQLHSGVVQGMIVGFKLCIKIVPK